MMVLMSRNLSTLSLLLAISTVLTRSAVEAASHHRYHLQDDRSTTNEQLGGDNLISALLDEYSRRLTHDFPGRNSDIDDRMLELQEEEEEEAAAEESKIREAVMSERMGLNLAETAGIADQGPGEPVDDARGPYPGGLWSNSISEAEAEKDAAIKDARPIEVHQRAWAAPCLNPAACPPINPYKLDSDTRQVRPTLWPLKRGGNGMPLKVDEQIVDDDGNRDAPAQSSAYRRLQTIMHAMESLLRKHNK